MLPLFDYEARVILTLTFEVLFLDVVPSEQIIDIGRQARLECLTEDRDRSAITWMKDGQALPNHPRFVANRQTLQIFNLQTDDYGMYQCFVARGNQEAQASSELRLGGNFPNACNFIFGRKGCCFSVCVWCVPPLPSLFFILLHKEWTGRPRDGSGQLLRMSTSILSLPFLLL